jgi:hypothetical protein
MPATEAGQTHPAGDGGARQRWWHSPVRLGFVAVPSLTLVVYLIYGSGYVDYDALYTLLWGSDIGHFHRPPDLNDLHSPTPHPLHSLIAAPLSYLGSGALPILEIISILCFAALGWFAYLLGSRVFGKVAGVVFALILLTRPVLVNQGLTANIDVPYLMLVIAALAIEVARPRRGWPVLLCLAAAGLLRPEAWLLSLAYLVWLMWEDRNPRAHVKEIALALSAPVLWMGFDLVTSGNPLHSLTHTSDAATRIGRPQGVPRAVRLLPSYLGIYVTIPLVLAGGAAGIAALWLRMRRAYLPIALGLLGGLGFLVLGVASLPLLARYLMVPAAMLALLVAGAVAAIFGSVPEVGRRARIAVTALGVLAVLAAIPLSAHKLQKTVDFAAARQKADHALPGLLKSAPVRDAIARCKPLQVVFFQTRPLAAYLLGKRPRDMNIGRPSRAKDGLVLVSKADRYRTPPPGFAPLARNHQWTLYGHCQ